MSVIMPLIDRVQKDMVAAMKGREEARLGALRMIKAALMKQKVDSPKPVDEAAEMAVLKTLIKQRLEAAEAFRKAGRAEQADKEEAERRTDSGRENQRQYFTSRPGEPFRPSPGSGQ
jgi:hypothetical protein